MIARRLELRGASRRRTAVPDVEGRLAGQVRTRGVLTDLVSLPAQAQPTPAANAAASDRGLLTAEHPPLINAALSA